MRVAVLVNAARGAEDALDPAALAARFAAVGVEARVLPLDADDVAGCVRAATEGVDAVVVGGGDGTLRAAAEGLAGTGVPLGVLPLGTFNHFARGLGLPTDLGAAIAAVATAPARPIAAGRIGGTLFLNNAALGLAPDVVVQRPELHGSRVLRALATIPVALAALFRMRRLHLTADLDGRRQTCATPFVFVTPNDYEPHLFQFAVRSRRADGRLHLFLTTPSGLLDFLRMAVRVIRGHLDRHLDASVVARAELTSRRPTLRVLVDGDVIHLPTPIVVEGVRDALLVIGAPAG